MTGAMLRHVPLKYLAAAEAAISSESTRSRRRALSAVVHECGHQRTPYGLVVEHMDLNLDGQVYKWPFVNPFAFLFHICTISADFLRFLMEHCASGDADIILYADETKPGNVLRPDQGRSATCIYWTIKQFPGWFRSRFAGLFLFGVLQSRRIEQIAGGSSGVLRKVMNTFWNQVGWNLHTVGVRIHSGRANFVFRARFGCFLGDEKEIKQFWQVKGASGTMLCCFCKNIMSRVDTCARDDYLQHFADATPDQFDMHTAQSYTEAKHLLKHEAQHGSRASLAKLSQALGISYGGEGVLWDEHLQFANPPDNTFWDWMHVLVASGGVFQYECNEFLRALACVGVSLQDVDAFACAVQWPGERNKLPRGFFAKRFVSKAGSHMHAFASEMMSVADVLVLFVDLVLQPASTLPQHCACFLLAVEILDVLASEQAHRQSERLRRLTRAHHTLYRTLYPGLAKPKLHYLFHLADCIERHGVCLNCFAGERKHRTFKAIASHTFAHFEEHITNRLLCDLVNTLSDRSSLLAEHLVGGDVAPDFHRIFPDLDDRIAEVFLARSARAKHVRMRKGDIVSAVYQGQEIVGFARFFMRRSRPCERDEHCVCMDLLHTSEGYWTRASSDTVVLDFGRITGVIPWVSVHNKIYLRLPLARF